MIELVIDKSNLCDHDIMYYDTERSPLVPKLSTVARMRPRSWWKLVLTLEVGNKNLLFLAPTGAQERLISVRPSELNLSRAHNLHLFASDSS